MYISFNEGNVFALVFTQFLRRSERVWEVAGENSRGMLLLIEKALRNSNAFLEKPLRYCSGGNTIMTELISVMLQNGIKREEKMCSVLTNWKPSVTWVKV